MHVMMLLMRKSHVPSLMITMIRSSRHQRHGTVMCLKAQRALVVGYVRCCDTAIGIGIGIGIGVMTIMIMVGPG